MSLSEALEESYAAQQASRRPRPEHPKGWEPHVEETGDTAVAVSEPTTDPNPDEAELIRSWGFDPVEWEIVGPINCRRWQANLGRDPDTGDTCVQWFYYYKANLQRRDKYAVDVDYERLLKEASRAKPRKPVEVGTDDPRTLVVCIADWQAGQRRGGGIEALVQRVDAMRYGLERRVRSLRKDGVNIEQIALLCLGDLVEGCDGHYAMQTSDTEHMRAQTKLVRRLLKGIVDHAAGLAPKVTLAAVPGNHGEKRKNGKAFTAWEDNLDVEIPEQVGDILAGNPDRWGHVSVQLPTGSDLTLTLDLSGTRIGMAHGHQFKGGGVAQQKVDRWWSHKAKHRHIIGDADVLVSGHYHHYCAWEEGTHDGGTRTWFQAPSLDGGSDWWEHIGGAPTRRGTLTFVVGEGQWERLEILR